MNSRPHGAQEKEFGGHFKNHAFFGTQHKPMTPVATENNK